MEVISISPQTDQRRETFLRHVFGENEGFICIAYAEPGNRKSFRQEFFKYPKDMPEILSLVNKTYQGRNIWFCPQLFDSKRREKETVKITPCSWADLDTCPPEELHIKPTIVVESSPGRYQGYWSYEHPIDPDDAENISQRIAYKHAEDGADKSGWDLTQLLRMPYTYNYKYASTPQIAVLDINRRRYRLSDFKADYPQVAGFEHLDIPLPNVSELPDGNKLLEDNRLKLTPMIWRLFQEEQKPTNKAGSESWSESLWKLELMLFEAGFSSEDVFAIAREAKCNKWNGNERLLWKDVCRAGAKHERDTNVIGFKDYVEKELATDDERRAVEAEDTFVERYITWARSLGDAAPQYHQAGAFVALSSLLAGNVQLPTSFGMVKPNLWFMILADTTLTRKTTSMDIAMDLVMEIDDDIVLATDGSIEGLLTSLGTRPGRPSVFLRDEFSGLLEMITKKDYYAGMPEFLTKLYDGKMQKRVLRKEVIEVRDPVLILFAGGIKNKIASLLSLEQVSSGFMPRFIFITAESDITKVKPLGPPTDWTDDKRHEITDELQDLSDHYRASTTMNVAGGTVSYEVQKKWNAELTPEAWFRYNEMESQMLDSGMRSDKPEVMTPTYDRLSKSMLKCAVLLAASRQREEKVIVEESDIVRAIVYGETWRTYVREIMNSIGKSQSERALDNIRRAIERKPGVSRSSLMQAYHLTARDASQMFETLEQRNQIVRQKNGRKEMLFPHKIT